MLVLDVIIAIIIDIANCAMACILLSYIGAAVAEERCNRSRSSCYCASVLWSRIVDRMLNIEEP